MNRVPLAQEWRHGLFRAGSIAWRRHQECGVSLVRRQVVKHDVHTVVRLPSVSMTPYFRPSAEFDEARR